MTSSVSSTSQRYVQVTIAEEANDILNGLSPQAVVSFPRELKDRAESLHNRAIKEISLPLVERLREQTKKTELLANEYLKNMSEDEEFVSVRKELGDVALKAQDLYQKLHQLSLILAEPKSQPTFSVIATLANVNLDRILELSAQRKTLDALKEKWDAFSETLDEKTLSKEAAGELKDECLDLIKSDSRFTKSKIVMKLKDYEANLETIEKQLSAASHMGDTMAMAMGIPVLQLKNMTHLLKKAYEVVLRSYEENFVCTNEELGVVIALLWMEKIEDNKPRMGIKDECCIQ